MCTSQADVLFCTNEISPSLEAGTLRNSAVLHRNTMHDNVSLPTYGKEKIMLAVRETIQTAVGYYNSIENHSLNVTRAIEGTFAYGIRTIKTLSPLLTNDRSNILWKINRKPLRKLRFDLSIKNFP